MANTVRDATAGYRERKGGDGASTHTNCTASTTRTRQKREKTPQRILTDTAIINEMNTRARGGNPADIPHHDIGFPLPQLHSLSISPSLICSPFACPLSYSALHHSVCNMFCKSVNIVPGVDLITSVGPTLFGCQYSNLSKHTLRHQADTHNRSPSPRSPTLHHPRCARPSHPTSSFACSSCMPPVCFSVCIASI